MPTIGFGENDIYKQADNHEGSWLYSLQQIVKRMVGFTIPIIEGRGLFHASFGWMPYQRPINVVIGEPVQVTHTKEPTDEEVDAMHERYVQALVKYVAYAPDPSDSTKRIRTRCCPTGSTSYIWNSRLVEVAFDSSHAGRRAAGIFNVDPPCRVARECRARTARRDGCTFVFAWE